MADGVGAPIITELAVASPPLPPHAVNDIAIQRESSDPPLMLLRDMIEFLKNWRPKCI